MSEANETVENEENIKFINLKRIKFQYKNMNCLIEELIYERSEYIKIY